LADRCFFAATTISYHHQRVQGLDVPFRHHASGGGKPFHPFKGGIIPEHFFLITLAAREMPPMLN